MLTIEDIRNPKRQSGFDNVKFTRPAHRATKPYNARTGHTGAGPKTNRWWGPNRATAEEAAQDYCDYVNNGHGPAIATLATIDKSNRPQKARRTITAREKRLRAALRDEIAENPPERMHDPVCYLIGIKNDIYAVKVGYADYNVYSRLDSLQTGNPRQLVLLGTLPGGIETEKRLHTKHAASNILQEWFRPTHPLLSEFGLTVREYSRKVH